MKIKQMIKKNCEKVILACMKKKITKFSYNECNTQGSNNNIQNGNNNINNTYEHDQEYYFYKQDPEYYLGILDWHFKKIVEKKEITNEQFNEAEAIYEKAKKQNPNHPTLRTFEKIAEIYYKRRIDEAKQKGENPFAYEMALERYTK